jgi:hypothetical protein
MESMTARGNEHSLSARHPMLDCPRCKAVITTAENESVRLHRAGASDQDVLNAAHQPRFATLREHELAWDEHDRNLG